MAGPLREPAVAGQFYEGDPTRLIKQIEGLIDWDRERVTAKGMVSPHAGLMYSGRAAGAVYSAIEGADTFIILGPNHQGLGSDFSIMTEGVWDGPIGRVRVDTDLAREIFKRSKYLADDPLAQSKEHSLEVQLPFIQYFFPDAQIVPISMSHYSPDDRFLEVCEQTGDAIAAAIGEFRHKVTIVASTDLTHYEPADRARENDRAAIDAIIAMDAEGLFRQVGERGISMCGYGPVAAMLFACARLGAKDARLVKYMSSADITGDRSSVVGYASLIVK